MTKDEALHKALKVLNCLNNDRVYETAWVKGAINACEESLATNEESSVVQLAQEPFYFVQHSNGYGWINVDKDEYNQEKYDENKWKLYTHPAPKPVAIVESHYGFTDAIVTFLTFNNEQLPVGTLLYANPTFEPAQGIELEWYNKGWDDAYTEALNLSEKQHTFPDKLDIANCDLKQPAQEPVAWLDEMQSITEQEYYQEPVAWTDEYKMFLEWDKASLCDKAVCKEHEAIPLYTYPHQWQRLSDKEMNSIRGLFSPMNVLGMFRAIEQALKEKNHV